MIRRALRRVIGKMQRGPRFPPGPAFEGLVLRLLLTGCGEGTISPEGACSTCVETVWPPDQTPPVVSSPIPSGSLPAGTRSTTAGVSTNEDATCRYDTTDRSYGDMASTFDTTGGTAHETTVHGLQNGQTYTYFVRCEDEVGNRSPSSLVIRFSVQPTGSGGACLPRTTGYVTDRTAYSVPSLARPTAAATSLFTK